MVSGYDWIQDELSLNKGQPELGLNLECLVLVCKLRGMNGIIFNSQNDFARIHYYAKNGASTRWVLFYTLMEGCLFGMVSVFIDLSLNNLVLKAFRNALEYCLEAIFQSVPAFIIASNSPKLIRPSCKTH